ncbi:MAG: Gfo/Idh/MocA family oxidoreductase [Syntrophales bacterium]|nr:Gfo/Idh/MocA family oxidoreductase [Syntrophales bacterium]
MERVKIGMVGAQFSARFHMNSLAKLRGVKVDVVAVAAQHLDHAEAFARTYGIPDCYDDYRRLLERKDIDIVDLCIPTDLHAQFVIEAARAGKHVICEKPLTGYFGKDRPEEWVGSAVGRELMLKETLDACDRVIMTVEKNGVKFMYAENWVYAPPFVKLKRLIKAGGGTVMDIRAEQSHSGSVAPYSRRWKTSGGGALMRLGAHPVGAVLHLKHYEGILRLGRPIKVKSVMAEVGQHAKMESVLREKKQYLVSAWEDVEDWGAVVITFEDRSSATILASDGVLGGVRNTMSVYLSNAAVHVNMNPSNVLEVYAPEPHIFGDEYLVEKLETKAGWNFPSPDDDWIRGYVPEMEDFVDAVLLDREPVSGMGLARDVVETIYAAYLSAEQGRRIEL